MSTPESTTACLHPEGAYYSEEHDNYYCWKCKAGMGHAYYFVSKERDKLTKQLAEREGDMRTFNEGAKFSTEMIQTLTRERDEALGALGIANQLIGTQANANDNLVEKLLKENDEARLACAAKDSALKIWANGLNPKLVTPDKIAAKIIEEALSPTIGADLMSELEQLRDVFETCHQLSQRSPELNMSNFDHDQVQDLNDAMIEICKVTNAHLTPKEPAK